VTYNEPREEYIKNPFLLYTNIYIGPRNSVIQNFQTNHCAPKIKIFNALEVFRKSLLTAAELRRNRIIEHTQ